MTVPKNTDKVFTGTQESYQIPLPLLSLSFFFNVVLQELQCFCKRRETKKKIFDFWILKPSTMTYF